MDTSDNLPTGRTIVLNDKFVESLDPQQLEGYLDAVVDVARDDHPDVDAAAEQLKQRLAGVSIEVAPVELSRIAEHLYGDGPADITVQNSLGEVLRRSEAPSHQPDQQAAATDPEDPARPGAFD